jgi:multiple sugar transport system substrate-binding protein
MDIHGYQLIWNEGTVRDGGVDPGKVPATWQDWQEWTTRLSQGDRFGAMVNTGTGGGVNWQFHGFMRQAAKRLGSVADFFSADGKKANFNNPAGNEALSLMADIYKWARMPLPTGPGNALLDLFEQRKVASMVNGPWNLNRLAQPDNPAVRDLRVTLAPQRDPSKPSWWAQSHQVALPRPQKVEENKRAASFDFVRWLSEHTFEWSKAGQIPASKKVLNSEQYQKSELVVHKHLKVWEKNLASAAFMVLHPKHVEVETELPRVLNKAITGEVSVQAALAEGEQLVNNIINQ